MGAGSNLTYLLIALGTVIFSLVVHESMHAWAGLKLGDDTAKEEGRISFNPLSHIDPYMTILLPMITTFLFGFPILAAKPVPFNPDRVKWGEFGAALIAAAGPISNFVLAGIAAVLIRVFMPDAPLDSSNPLVIFAAINVGIGVFNLVPIPPLDGSRIVYAFAPEPLQEVMARLEVFGLFLVFGLIILFPPFSTILVSVNTAILNFLL